MAISYSNLYLLAVVDTGAIAVALPTAPFTDHCVLNRFDYIPEYGNYSPVIFGGTLDVTALPLLFDQIRQLFERWRQVFVSGVMMKMDVMVMMVVVVMVSMAPHSGQYVHTEVGLIGHNPNGNVLHISAFEQLVANYYPNNR